MKLFRGLLLIVLCSSLSWSMGCNAVPPADVQDFDEGTLPENQDGDGSASPGDRNDDTTNEPDDERKGDPSADDAAGTAAGALEDLLGQGSRDRGGAFEDSPQDGATGGRRPTIRDDGDDGSLEPVDDCRFVNGFWQSDALIIPTFAAVNDTVMIIEIVAETLVSVTIRDGNLDTALEPAVRELICPDSGLSATFSLDHPDYGGTYVLNTKPTDFGDLSGGLVIRSNIGGGAADIVLERTSRRRTR